MTSADTAYLAHLQELLEKTTAERDLALQNLKKLKDVSKKAMGNFGDIKRQMHLLKERTQDAEKGLQAEKVAHNETKRKSMASGSVMESMSDLIAENGRLKAQMEKLLGVSRKAFSEFNTLKSKYADETYLRQEAEKYAAKLHEDLAAARVEVNSAHLAVADANASKRSSFNSSLPGHEELLNCLANTEDRVQGIQAKLESVNHELAAEKKLRTVAEDEVDGLTKKLLDRNQGESADKNLEIVELEGKLAAALARASRAEQKVNNLASLDGVESATPSSGDTCLALKEFDFSYGGLCPSEQNIKLREIVEKLEARGSGDAGGGPPPPPPPPPPPVSLKNTVVLKKKSEVTGVKAEVEDPRMAAMNDMMERIKAGGVSLKKTAAPPSYENPGKSDMAELATMLKPSSRSGDSAAAPNTAAAPEWETRAMQSQSVSDRFAHLENREVAADEPSSELSSKLKRIQSSDDMSIESKIKKETGESSNASQVDFRSGLRKNRSNTEMLSEVEDTESSIKMPQLKKTDNFERTSSWGSASGSESVKVSFRDNLKPASSAVSASSVPSSGDDEVLSLLTLRKRISPTPLRTSNISKPESPVVPLKPTSPRSPRSETSPLTPRSPKQSPKPVAPPSPKMSPKPVAPPSPKMSPKPVAPPSPKQSPQPVAPQSPKRSPKPVAPPSPKQSPQPVSSPATTAPTMETASAPSNPINMNFDDIFESIENELLSYM